MKIERTGDKQVIGLAYSELKPGRVYALVGAKGDSEVLLKTSQGHVYVATGDHYESRTTSIAHGRFVELDAKLVIGN